MFADYVKMAAKIAVIAVVTGLIIALLSSVQLPAFDTNGLVQAVGIGRAVMNYYVPAFDILFTLALSLLSLKYIIVPTLRITLIAFRWILKVNE